MSLVLPYPSDWDQWTGFLCELYPDLPEVPDEQEWASWAENLLQLDDFFEAPSPIGFSSWADWAQRVVGVML